MESKVSQTIEGHRAHLKIVAGVEFVKLFPLKTTTSNHQTLNPFAKDISVVFPLLLEDVDGSEAVLKTLFDKLKSLDELFPQSHHVFDEEIVEDRKALRLVGMS